MIETEHSVSLFHDHVIRTIRIQPCCLNATKRAPQHQSGGCRHASHLPNMGTNGPMGPMPNLVKNLCSWKTISTFNRIPPNSSSDFTIVACQHVSMSACQHVSMSACLLQHGPCWPTIPSAPHPTWAFSHSSNLPNPVSFGQKSDETNPKKTTPGGPGLRRWL